MHLQNRKGEDHAAEAGQERSDNQRAPEAETEILRTERQKIGTDRIKGNETEIQQAGKANDDIEAETQQAVDQGEDGNT